MPKPIVPLFPKKKKKKVAAPPIPQKGMGDTLKAMMMDKQMPKKKKPC